jgi:hypothetical protein
LDRAGILDEPSGRELASMGYLRLEMRPERKNATPGRRLLATLLLVAAPAWLASSSGTAAAATALYDKPAKVQHLPLPSDPQNPQAKTELSCIYFRHFMVKEVDLGEKGADQLSILPLAAGLPMPVCRRENAADEKVVSPNDWSGYFDGVKGSYVFFSADDGWNDGMGFAVFAAADAKKLFDDVAKKWRSIALTPSGIAMRYERVYGATCSLQADRAGCWRKIKQDTGLEGAAPDCTAAYKLEEKRTPTMVQSVIDDPTVIDYEAVASIDASGVKIAPVTGKAMACRPSE